MNASASISISAPQKRCRAMVLVQRNVLLSFGTSVMTGASRQRCCRNYVKRYAVQSLSALSERCSFVIGCGLLASVLQDASCVTFCGLAARRRRALSVRLVPYFVCLETH